MPITSIPPERTPPLTRLTEPEVRRVFSVEALSATCQSGKLRIEASVSTNSGGWSQPILRPLGHADGVASYEVVAHGPTGPAVSMMMQKFVVPYEEPAQNSAGNIRVLAEQNEMTVQATGCDPAEGR